MQIVMLRSTEVGLIVSAVLACAACAPNSTVHRTTSTPAIHPSPSPQPTTPVGTGPLLKGTVSVSGSYAVTSTFITRAELIAGSSLVSPPSSATCANYANGFAQNPMSFAAPELQTTGDTTAYLTATVASGYHGPGTYSSASTPTLSGSVAVAVGDVAQGGFVDTFRSGTRSTTSLIVRPDGSGKLEFSGWGTGDSDEDGTVTWTCG